MSSEAKVVCVITKHDGCGRVEITEHAFTTAEHAARWCEEHNPPKGQAPYYEYAAVRVHY